MAVEDVDFLDSIVHVVRQVKLLRNRPVFAPPKGGKERDVPLPESIAFALAGHLHTVSRGRGDVALEDSERSTSHGVAHLPES
ncbi:hypothetical protein ACWD6R_14340 [Streptomyces sp. NPDC005151]